jgi:hypothetical protein
MCGSSVSARTKAYHNKRPRVRGIGPLKEHKNDPHPGLKP